MTTGSFFLEYEVYQVTSITVLCSFFFFPGMIAIRRTILLWWKISCLSLRCCTSSSQNSPEWNTNTYIRVIFFKDNLFLFLVHSIKTTVSTLHFWCYNNLFKWRMTKSHLQRCFTRIVLIVSYRIVSYRIVYSFLKYLCIIHAFIKNRTHIAIGNDTRYQARWNDQPLIPSCYF